MKEYKILYPWSREGALRSNEMELWRESYTENCKCARAIEQIINKNYRDNRLNEEGAKQAISEFGYDRVNWVLANTVQENIHDGRYSEENKSWSRRFRIPRDENFKNYTFALTTHPGLVNVFIRQVQKEWEKLGLYTAEDCYDEVTDYTGKVVAICPETLKDEYKTPEDQLFYAMSGNGCRAETLGRKIYGKFLNDDSENVCFLRSEIIGVVKLEILPDWAKEKYAELTGKMKNETQENADENQNISNSHGQGQK